MRKERGGTEREEELGERRERRRTREKGEERSRRKWQERSGRTRTRIRKEWREEDPEKIGSV